MGLRFTAERLGWPQPKLFNNEVYKYMNRFILSTSTLSTETVRFGGFGPVVFDGFGIAYGVFNNKVGAFISSYKVIIKLNLIFFVEKFITLFSVILFNNLNDRKLVSRRVK